MHYVSYRPLSVAIALLWASCANAQSITQLNTVNVSASPLGETSNFDSPTQVDVVSGDDKLAKDSGSLGALIADIPGVNNLSTGSQAGKPIIRGMSGERVKILSNGLATDTQAYGTRHNPTIEPFLAESVEVVRGAQGVLYGSEAMGGVVNVISSPIPYGDKQPKNEAVSGFASNNGEVLLGVKGGVAAGNFGVTGGISQRTADNITTPKHREATGAKPSSPASKLPLFTGDLPYTNFENRAGNIGAGYRGDWGKVELRASRFESQQNFLGAVAANANSPYVAQPTGQLLTNDEYQLSGQINLAQGWTLKPHYMHTRYQRQAITGGTYSQLSSSKASPNYLDILVRRDELKLGLQHPQIGLFKGELGVEWMDKQQDLLAGKLAPNASESGQAIYLFEEAKTGNWTWNMGLRHDLRHMKAPLAGNSYFVNTGIFNGSNNDKSLENTSASLGMVYALTPQWNLATNIGTGFRAPSIFERYAGGIHGGVQAFQLGNPDLKAETSLNTDVSLRFMGDVTTLNATVYQNWVDNDIYLMNTGRYRNSNGTVVAAGSPGALIEMTNAQTDAIIRGLEVSGTWDVTRKLMLESGLEVIDGEDTKNQRKLSLMPANNLRIKAHYTLGSLGNWQENRVSLGARFVDSKSAAFPYEHFSQYDNLSTGTASTEAYTLWDLAYRTHYKVNAQQQLTLMANIDNLFDTAYYDFLDTYKGYAMSMGRNARITAKLSF